MGNEVTATLKRNSTARYKKNTLKVRRPRFEKARNLLQITTAMPDGDSLD